MDFENLLNFERASVATYYDADGVLQTAAIDEPRLDHDPVTLEPLGLLIEEQRTNIAPYSENLSLGWNNVKVVTTPAQESGRLPLSLSKIAENTETGTHDLTYPVGVSSAGQLSFSFVFKPSQLKNRKLRVYFIGFSEGNVAAGFSVGVNGVLSATGGLAEATSEQIAVDTFLIKGTTKLIYGDDLLGAVFFRLEQLDGSLNYTGDGASHIFLGEIQIEEGGFSTSYIPTTGAPATRSPDICSIKSVDPWIDQNEGTLYVHLNKKAGSYVGNYLTLSDGTSSNQVVIKDRSVFYKETNYMPSPFDPVSWSAADPDGTKSNITLSNPSGSSIVGECSITSGNYTFITTFSSFNASIGEKMYLCIIVKNVSADNVFVRFQSDSGTEDQTQVSLTTLTKVTGGSDVLVTPLSDGFSLLQAERVASANLVNADILVYANGDGGQFYAQAAFFGKANDWPAIINDANVIQAGVNNLTGVQSFAAPLESGESKLAISYDGSTYSAAKDGVAFSGVNAGVPALTDLYIGSGEDGSSRYFNGHIIDAQYFPRKLDESELVDLTT
jgi:hypothetical protein